MTTTALPNASEVTVSFETYGNKLNALADLCDDLGLQPGFDTDVTFAAYQTRDYSAERDYRVFWVQLRCRFAAMSDQGRRAAKRFVELEVPSYALDGRYKEPPLRGERKFKLADGDEFHVELTIDGAYVCEQKGEEEREPAEFEVKEAEKLAALTPDEVMAEHWKRVAEMRKPRLVATYTCKPKEV